MSLPPSEIPQGAIRFNTDSQKLEFYAQGEWWVMSTDTPNLGRSSDSTPGARVIVAGGNNYQAPASDVHGEIQYFNIASTGNSVDFGTNLTTSRRRLSAMSSSTRGVFSGGATPGAVSTQDFVTISSTGTCTAWGDSANNTGTCDNMGFSNSTRGISKSGYQSPGVTGTMDYITIASAGNTVDFGDLDYHGDAAGAAANSTRALLGGQYASPGGSITSFVTMHTLGNNTQFGDLTVGRFSVAACANTKRVIWGGGQSPTTRNTLDYIEIASLGNAIDFGDLAAATSTACATSNCIRGVWSGGYEGNATDRIQYVQMESQGDTVDFGNLSVKNGGGSASCSNAHGGL
jgi:hypothetical protein